MYLKYDKKLILEVDDLLINYISSNNKEVTTEELKEKFLIIPKLLKYFGKIDIERLRLKNNEFTILINEKQLYIDNKDINLSASLEFVDEQMKMNIYSMYFKALNLTFFGKSIIQSSKDSVVFSGFFTKDDNLNGEINLKLDDKYLDFFVNTTNSIESIKFLKDFFRLDPIAEEWMYNNVQGKIDLKYLSGKIDLKKQEPILSSIKGEASISNAKIKFNEELKAVDTSDLKLYYENDILLFDLHNPRYGNNNLNGSKVWINHLTDIEKGRVVINLKSDALINDEIIDILKAYEINLPLKQIDGEIKSSLKLEIPYLSSKKMKTTGTFLLKEANLKLNDFAFFVKKANVFLNDNLISINESLVKYNNLIESELSLNIDTKTMLAKGKMNILNFVLKADEKELLNLSNKEVPLNINFNNDILIDLKSLDSKIIIEEKSFVIDIPSLESFYDISSILKENGLKKGSLKVKINEENKITFFINLDELDFPFEKNGKIINKLSAHGTILEDEIKIKTDNSDLEIILKKNETPLIKLFNIDLALNQEKNSLSKEFPNVDLELK